MREGSQTLHLDLLTFAFPKKHTMIQRVSHGMLLVILENKFKKYASVFMILETMS